MSQLIPGITSIDRGERIYVIRTTSTLHFTEAIILNAEEYENIDMSAQGFRFNKLRIIGINLQSIQNLKYQVSFYESDTFADIDLDVDTFLAFHELDMSTPPAFRVAAAGQYKMEISDLNTTYEDAEETFELHVGLLNLSGASKIAGALGAVQIDFLVTPRL